MSQVGAFPGMNYRTNIIRGPINPLDKSTIISILPKEIDEVKHTLNPGRWIISPGSFNKPTFFTVGPSSWWREIYEDETFLEIPVSSIQIADSIIKDYSNGILACDMGDSKPGLGFIPGEYNLEKLNKDYPNFLAKLKFQQSNWFSRLVKLADMLWARSNGNPLTICEDMRMAARELNLASVKDWMKDFSMVEMIRCFSCGTLKNPDYPTCPTCRAIDSSNPKSKDIKFAV